MRTLAYLSAAAIAMIAWAASPQRSAEYTHGETAGENDTRDEVIARAIVLRCASEWDEQRSVVGGPTAQITTEFDYHNYLTQDGVPVTGDTLFVFLLYDDETSPFLSFIDLHFEVSTVADGWFAVNLDFGPDLFGGQNAVQVAAGRTHKQRWLKMLVQYPDGIIEVFPDRIPFSPLSFSMRAIDRYADVDARAAMGEQMDDNPLNHDRYTDDEARDAVGPTGISGYEFRSFGINDFPTGFGVTIEATVRCPEGKKVLGGGGRLTNGESVLRPMVRNGPLAANGNLADDAWTVAWIDTNFNPALVDVQVFCLCADVSP